MVTDVLNFNT